MCLCLTFISLHSPLCSGLPPGFKLTDEILNAEKPTLPPPAAIHYNEKHSPLLLLVVGLLSPPARLLPPAVGGDLLLHLLLSPLLPTLQIRI